MDFLTDRLGLRRPPARVDLGVVCTPVVRYEQALGPAVWVKRDDLNSPAPAPGGNKVRALEYLLAPASSQTTIVTVGGEGSTHVLATAVHSARMGLRTIAWRWPHFLNEIGADTSAAISRHCLSSPMTSGPISAFLRGRLRALQPDHLWVPFGGASPLGLLGHVNAAFELADQIKRGELPLPSAIYCPHGTGGTAAGLALGLALAAVDATVVAVRAGPRSGIESLRLRRFAHGAMKLLEAHSPRVELRHPDLRIRVDHRWYSGAYARPLPEAQPIAAAARPHGLWLDGTYTARTATAAVEEARATGRPTLLWHTFDSRWLASPSSAPGAT
ncbi:MAG: pyridoxal-phosphate dependent enzyme [Gemmatimonadota bacterium]